MSVLSEICNCFQGLIGLRDFCDADPNCELYINTLPGINNQILASLTDMERETVLSVFSDIEKRAAIHVHRKISLKLKEGFKKKYDSGLIITGDFDCDEFTTIEQGNLLSGVLIDNSASPYLSVSIPEIRLYSNEDMTGLNIWIFNVGTGRVEKVYQVDVVQGVNYIELNPPFILSNKADRFFIALDLSQANVSAPCSQACCSNCGHEWRYSSQVNDYSYGGGFGRAIQNQLRDPYQYHPFYENYPQYRCNCQTRSDSCVKINTDTEAISLDTIISPSALEAANNCPFAICYRKQCSWSQLICQNKQELSEAFWYQLGIEFWDEPQFGQSVGTFQLIPEEEVEKRKNELRRKRDEAIKCFVEDLQVNDICFECEDSITILSQIP